MSTSAYPCSNTRIDEKLVKKVCGKVFDRFMLLIEKSGSNFELFCLSRSVEDGGDFDDEADSESGVYFDLVDTAFEKVRADFKKKTKLSLGTFYIGGEAIGDVEQGGHFSIIDAMDYTPAAKKFMKTYAPKEKNPHKVFIDEYWVEYG